MSVFGIRNVKDVEFYISEGNAGSPPDHSSPETELAIMQ